MKKEAEEKQNLEINLNQISNPPTNEINKHLQFKATKMTRTLTPLKSTYQTMKMKH